MNEMSSTLTIDVNYEPDSIFNVFIFIFFLKGRKKVSFTMSPSVKRGSVLKLCLELTAL